MRKRTYRAAFCQKSPKFGCNSQRDGVYCQGTAIGRHTAVPPPGMRKEADITPRPGASPRPARPPERHRNAVPTDRTFPFVTDTFHANYGHITAIPLCYSSITLGKKPLHFQKSSVIMRTVERGRPLLTRYRYGDDATVCVPGLRNPPRTPKNFPRPPQGRPSPRSASPSSREERETGNVPPLPKGRRENRRGPRTRRQICKGG